MPRRIPFVAQQADTDCGSACLAMVLASHGCHVRLDEVRRIAGHGRDGASARALLDAARRLGLRGRAVRVEPEDLGSLAPGAILHWDFRHFVVLERIFADRVVIVDPAFGRRSIALAHLRRSFTGVALVLEPSEAFSRRPPPASPLRRYLRELAAHRGLWSRILVAAALMQLFALAVPALTGAIVDRVVPRADQHLLLVLLAGGGMVVVFQLLAHLVRGHLLLQLQTSIDARLTSTFMEHLGRLPLPFFQQHATGDLLMRVASNATIRDILASGVLSALLDGTLVLGYLAVLAVVSPPLALVTLVVAAVQGAIQLLTHRPQRELTTQYLHAQAQTRAHEVELVRGIEALKSMGAEPDAIERWSHHYTASLNVALRRGRLEASVGGVLAALRLLAPLAILGTGAHLVVSGQLGLGGMLAAQAIASAFLVPLGALLDQGVRLQQLRSHLDRAEEVLAAPPERERGHALDPGSLHGAIELQDVTFAYEGTATPVVQRVHLRVAPGQMVAIVGGSGAGKSTLGRIFLGLLRPSHGRVLVDGRDLAELDLGAVRRRLGVVTQDPYVFAGSIRDNLALVAPHASLEELVAAARIAQIHDEIAAMPLGYDTPVGDGGSNLSGGQRQRLALARALVRWPRLLLLDEATSALDAVTEANVHAALASLQCTRIVVAHRLSTIQRADRIVVLDGGRVVEEGTHLELLARGGAYARLVRAQLGERPSPIRTGDTQIAFAPT